MTALARRLGTFDATIIGVGSMIGAGAFAAWAPAAAAAGPLLLVSLGVAALVAVANATSTAQLAAVMPVAGGAYVYGRERLGPWWGFLAGWGFVIGKSASAAAMALVATAYLLPRAWQQPIAAALVLLLALLNAAGITRTARATRVIVAVVLLVLLLVVVAAVGAPMPPGAALDWSAYGVLQGAGILFFAFAGYARVATLGEEVRDPARTIPRAVLLALVVALAVYLLVGGAALAVLGPTGLAQATAPLVAVVEASGWRPLAPVVRVAAALAALGALLALLAGIGRTALAMARERDLPAVLDAVHPRFRTPHRAELLVGAVVAAAVLLVDLREAIGFSSFGVLLYYAVANVAALRQPSAERRFPRALAVVGLLGCGALVATLPWQSIAAGAAVLGLGALIRLLRRA
jgi:APA family basic amino acid/polyamine antiporter